MAEEFTIKSETIESKINQLLPSQGGFGAGVDFSASTMVIPIVDLTETAEGSGLREDLQKSLSYDSITSFSASNITNKVILNTTGYYRVFGTAIASGSGDLEFNLFDGSTKKDLLVFAPNASVDIGEQFDFLIFLKAGYSLRATASSPCAFFGVTRQIADLDGNLVNPA